MKYKVRIEESSLYWKTVEANSLDKAMEAAEEEAGQGDLGNHVDTNYEIYAVEDEKGNELWRT